jgi:hypothetical protein
MTKQQSDNAVQSLLEEKLRNFAAAFCGSSRKLFVDAQGTLVHSGEFGAYREAIVREYLRSFMPQRMAIDTGFLVNSSGSISHQCDVVIYDKSITPLLQSESYQRFYPIESVCAVGEVKSVVSLSELKVALRKMARAKSMRETLHEPYYVHCTKEEANRSVFQPTRDEQDQLVTFLICEKFSFDVAANIEEVLSCYAEELPHYPVNLRHNFILSIEDGLICYVAPSGALYPYSNKSTIVDDYEGTDELKSTRIEMRMMKNRLILCQQGSFEHLRHFSVMFHSAISLASIFFPDMGRYIKSQDDVMYKDIDPVR